MNKPDNPPPPIANPFGILIALLLIIFVLETVVMTLLPFVLPHTHGYLQSLADAFFLAILSAPFIWLLIARPLRLAAMNEFIRTKATLANIVEAVIDFDSEGIIQSLNSAAEKMFGYASGELIGQHVNRIIPGMEAVAGSPTRDESTTILGNDFRIDPETVGCHKEGASFPVEISISKLSLSGAKAFIAIVHDITERKSMESCLMEKKEFAESLVQNSTVPTFVLDKRHRVIGWNRACEELTGVKAAAVLGTDEHWKAFYAHQRPLLADFAIDGSPKNILDYYSFFSKSNVNPEGLQAEGWLPGLNGCDRFLCFGAAPIRDKQGAIVAAIETLEDITERRKSEEKIQQALSLLRATLEATTDGILVTDLSGKIIAYNRQFTEMWQIPESVLDTEIEQQVLKLALVQLKNPDTYAAHVREHYEKPESEDRYVFEFSDGRIFERYSKPQRIGDKIVGRVRSFRDMTEQRKLESQLRHAQKMDAIGTLAGGVAHDFNNILTAIIGYGSLLDMKLGQSDPSRPFIENILSAANRAASLTNSLLTFGRKQTIEPRAVDLNSIVQRVTTLLLCLLREDIELRTTLAETPCMVMADVDQIEQVFMNLTTNARDAMPKGGTLALATSMITLDRDFVATHGYGTPGRFVLLTVTDSGTGMDAETMSRIFDPFFTTKEVGKGTGLGLSMAYGIIKQHNGYITCYSEPGTGTTFRLYLPAVNALAEPVQISAAEPPPRGTETILLAEDDEQVRRLTTNLLQSFGYTVIAVRDGRDALVQFDACKDVIQLVLLDVIMPRMNGREAYEEMESKRPGLKVLFTSGYSADIFQRGEFDASGFAFISKPVLPAELLRKIRQLLDE